VIVDEPCFNWTIFSLEGHKFKPGHWQVSRQLTDANQIKNVKMSFSNVEIIQQNCFVYLTAWHKIHANGSNDNGNKDTKWGVLYKKIFGCNRGLNKFFIVFPKKILRKFWKKNFINGMEWLFSWFIFRNSNGFVFKNF